MNQLVREKFWRLLYYILSLLSALLSIRSSRTYIYPETRSEASALTPVASRIPPANLHAIGWDKIEESYTALLGNLQHLVWSTRGGRQITVNFILSPLFLLVYRFTCKNLRKKRSMRVFMMMSWCNRLNSYSVYVTCCVILRVLAFHLLCTLPKRLRQAENVRGWDIKYIYIYIYIYIRGKTPKTGYEMEPTRQKETR